jgi:hypothetical protein
MECAAGERKSAMSALHAFDAAHTLRSLQRRCSIPRACLCSLNLRIPLILISHSGRSRSPIPVILITVFTMPEEGTADSMTWRLTATTDG